MRSLVIAAFIGGLLGGILPAKAILSASAELIAFVTLIMAGLIPAMILTATAIKGDAFSTARVREYGEGLRRQLQFWAVLFGYALASVIAICAAKISDQAASVTVGLPGWSIDVGTSWLTRALVVLGSAALAIVIVRMYPSYRGLRSLLDLTIKMAEAQALSNDRSFADALDAKIARVGTKPASIPMEWPNG